MSLMTTIRKIDTIPGISAMGYLVVEPDYDDYITIQPCPESLNQFPSSFGLRLHVDVARALAKALILCADEIKEEQCKK